MKMNCSVAGLYEYELESDSSPFRAELQTKRLSPEVEIVRLRIEADCPAVPPVFKLKWSLPVVDTVGTWHTEALYRKSLRADWAQPLDSRSTYAAPVMCLFGGAGNNRLTFAFSDVLNVIRFDAGVREENARFQCYVKLFDTPAPPLSAYEAELRIDVRKLPYYDCLKDVSKWWGENEANRPAPVPAAAYEPVYSTWYSFHQQLTPEEIETQCRLSCELGCRTVIVDDGWQTADNARGYDYCGDWEVCGEKIPDMKAHVQRVHALGMNYLLWYSVPFIGQKTKAWERFKDKILYTISEGGPGVIDPRYPEVREYMIGLYERAMTDWDLDGFKLDFVDVFGHKSPDKEPEIAAPGRDPISVPQAVDAMLSEVIRRLTAIKPDVMIEFRQSYISALMRKYGNLFRASDCPNDAIQNRVRTIDLRLLSGNTAVHSDMIMWNAGEPVDSAALQLINILFAVPQISVRLDMLPQEHLQMVRYWLAFWRKYRDTLMHGYFAPHRCEANYPLVTARDDSVFVAVAYGEAFIALDGSLPDEVVLVNGTREGRLVAHTAGMKARSVCIRDCTGRVVDEYRLGEARDWTVFRVPPSGTAVLI